jgi:hypothetical protein
MRVCVTMNPGITIPPAASPRSCTVPMSVPRPAYCTASYGIFKHGFLGLAFPPDLADCPTDERALTQPALFLRYDGMPRL